MHRRTFLAGSLSGAVACGFAPRGANDVCLAADAPRGLDTGLDVVDCHTHFYDPTRPEGIPWPAEGSPLYRTVLPKHLREVKQFRPVTGTVIVEASPRVEDNAWLLDLASDDPFIVGIVGRLHPGEADFAKHLKRFAANPLFRGIRISVQLLTTLLDRQELSDLELLADHDLALDVNGGPETPAALARLAQRLPALRVVLNHMGNVRITPDAPPSQWKAGIQAAAEHANVFCKISALVEGAARGNEKAPSELDFYRPYIDVVWNAFGDSRVIYGSNWPVSDRAADYQTVQRIA
ncbi:MAG: amidohydrolase family protein, partial [Candidatus Paceibacterota bacterium]